MNIQKKLLGVVLCGGRSSRMGSDKGMMLSSGESWAGLIYRKLYSLAIPIVVSVNQDQEVYYQSVFGKNMLVKDSYQIPGPLNGLLSVHDQFPEYDLFVVACDLIDIKEDVLKHLYSLYLSDSGLSQNYSYFTEGCFESVCSIYSATTLQQLKDDWKDGKVTDFSLQHLLQQSDTCPVQIPPFFNYCFENYNYQEQVEKRRMSGSEFTEL